MPQVVEFTLAIGVWVLEGFRPSGAVVAMRPLHPEALGVNVPDESSMPGFPSLPEEEGIWVVTCPAELPAFLDDEEFLVHEALSAISISQLAWDTNAAVWRQANSRDLYILRGETPPTSSEGPQ